MTEQLFRDRLDPQLRALLEQAALATGAPSIRELPLDEGRKAYRERYLARGIRGPQAGVHIDKLTMSLGERMLSARLYRVAGGVAAPALMVYFHGGGYVVGDQDAYDLQSRALAAASGCSILFVEYRLAPENPFPAAVEDGLESFAWAHANAAELGFSPDRILVGGDSAGGALAMVVALSRRDRGEGLPRLCMGLYPWVDMRPYRSGQSYRSVEAFSSGYFLDRETMEWFSAAYLSGSASAEDHRASPILWNDFEGMPETIIVTAEFDPLRDMGEAFAARLVCAGVDVTSMRMQGMIHNFIGYADLSDAAARAFAEIARRLRLALS